jgi:hypothetical protein
MGTIAGLHIGSALIGAALLWLLTRFLAGRNKTATA